MENLALFFSALFFLAFGIYLSFGIYLMQKNRKSNLNRSFFALCVALSLWSLGFAVANSAPTVEISLLWRRIAAVGWSTAYSLLLLFFMLLTEVNSSTKMKFRHWVIFLPALVCLYVFAFSPKLAKTQYNLVLRETGWLNVAVNNGWDFFFYFYYASYMVASLVLLWRWQQRKDDLQVRRDSNLILTSILVAGVLGTLTDVVFSSLFKTPLPQMAPLIVLLPIGAAYYSLKHASGLGAMSDQDEEAILDEASESRLFYYLGLTFFAGGLLGILAYFLPPSIHHQQVMATAVSTGIILTLIGVLILALQAFVTGEERNTFIMLITLSSIPLISLRFVRFAGTSVWAFPLLFMIVFLVLDTKLPLVGVASLAVITQIMFWQRIPTSLQPVDIYDFIIRAGFFLLALWLGTFVNKVYRRKLKENTYQKNFQRMLSEVSLDFMSITQANVGLKINEMLQEIGQFFQVDQTYLYLFDPLQGTMSKTHRWQKEGLAFQLETYLESSFEKFSWLRKELVTTELIYIPDPKQLPAEAKLEKMVLYEQGIKSLLILPIAGNKGLLGFMGLESVVEAKNWTSDQLKLLPVLANLLRDALMKIKAEREIELLAYYDEVTGLPNRTLFADRLEQALQLAQRNAHFVGVMFLDLDGFKMVNDVMGHSSGDLVLREVAVNLEKNVRKSDTVARFGADEFLIMLNDIPDADVIPTIARKIVDLFQKPFLINNQEFFITASVGVAIYPADGEDVESLLKNADIAMQRAKNNGKNQYVLCTPHMKEEVKRDMRLSNNLFRALERNELLIYYQPQINLQTCEISGLEALLRWQHPEMGLISPGIFIPLAEQSGLINNIGEWVLREVSKQNKKWQKQGLPPLRMAVNLSVIQFNNPRIVDQVGSILQENDLEPHYLELEITENVAIMEPSYTIGILKKLKDLGVTIAVDDFGTEYSSLSRLKYLPIDRLKIDMQFVQGIDENPKDRAITEVVINLGKSLNLGVLAEGVETSTQLQFLKENGCDDAQGFYYHKPMPAAEIEKLLRSNGKRISSG